jgi:hypothetical protein
MRNRNSRIKHIILGILKAAIGWQGYTTLFMFSFAAGTAYRVTDFTLSRVVFFGSAVSLALLMNSLSGKLPEGRRRNWCRVAIPFVAGLYLWGTWYLVAEREAEKTQTRIAIPGLGISKSLSTAATYLSVLPRPWILVLGIAIGALALIGIGIPNLRRRRRKEAVKPRVKILRPLDLGSVGWHRIVSGSVFPPDSGVQALVQFPNDGWYPQPTEVKGGLWTSNCRFGPREKAGGSYKIVAVHGATFKDKKDELDEGWIKSEIVTVNRKSDEDIIDCSAKDLHQTKIDDKSAIKELVKVCMVKCDTSIIENGPPPYVDFDFWILSLSLHRVSIKSISGYITFQKDATGDSIKLIGTPELREESHAENIAFRSTDGWVRIRQPLDLNQAPWVKSGLDHSVFYFHHLNIMVEGDGFEPVRLDVDKVQKRIPYWPQDECKFLYATVAESETKVRELETANKALKTELDHLNREASDPTEKLE